MVFHDDWIIYRFGGKYKLCYFKTGQKHQKKNYDEELIERYKFNDPSLTDMQYDKAYQLILDREKKKKHFESFDINSSIDDKIERFSQSVSRSRSLVFEIAMCNDFEYFCTFTLDDKLRDRYNLKSFRKDFAQFIRNENRGRDKKIKYLVVPEQHKDGAWHFHGLLSGLSESDLSVNEFGYLDWNRYKKRFGFFSCSPIKDREKCSSYVTKYITKDIEDNFVFESGDHLFFASQGLKRKEVVHHEMLELCPVEEFDFENDYVKIKWLDDDDKSKFMSLHF